MIEAPRTLITDKIKGKTVEFVGVQDNCLVIATTDGQIYRSGWRDSTNTLVPGSPSLEGIDMNLVLPPVELWGKSELG